MRGCDVTSISFRRELFSEHAILVVFLVINLMPLQMNKTYSNYNNFLSEIAEYCFNIISADLDRLGKAAKII